jgi:hypothetical protein
MSGERLNRHAVLVLFVLAGVLAYATFLWGGLVRTSRYQYLLVLGLLAMLLSPDRVLRWTAAFLPTYVLLWIVPLPVAAASAIANAGQRRQMPWGRSE